jgi:predicted transposase/invertase (TIGR01784 family)
MTTAAGASPPPMTRPVVARFMSPADSRIFSRGMLAVFPHWSPRWFADQDGKQHKLTIVDVKARDATQRLFQIEIQLLVFAELASRILYGWANLYSQQLQSGQDHRELKPTYAIWILDQSLRREDCGYAHRYRMRDDRGYDLVDHGSIWVLELNKFAAGRVETERERWLKFFKEAERFDETALPDWMHTAEMRQAMSTLNAFSEKERAYHAYQARQEFLRQQRSIQKELEEARAATEAALQEKEAERKAKEAERQEKEAERKAKEAERQQKEAALAEVERLTALLEQEED